jgi:hypothetical protein
MASATLSGTLVGALNARFRTEPRQVAFVAKQRARAANTRVVALLAFGCKNNIPKTGRPFALPSS